MNPNDPLSALHDIHLPAPVSWWPPAPAWWVLAALLLILAASGLWYAYRRYRRGAFKRQALRELRQLRAAAQRGADAAEIITDLALLLRRTALAVFARDQVAGLHGRAWLDFLDRTGGNGAFTRGVGHYVAAVPYQKTLPVNADKDLTLLLQLAKTWIRRQ